MRCSPPEPCGQARRCCCWRLFALPAYVLRSAMNARITRNQPKPVTPRTGAYTHAHASVVHGSRKNPRKPIQKELNAMPIRSVNTQVRNTARRGDASANRATMHPHIRAGDYPLGERGEQTVDLGGVGRRRHENDFVTARLAE